MYLFLPILEMGGKLRDSVALFDQLGFVLKKHRMNLPSSQQRLSSIESLEARQLMTSVPFGASSQDVAEVMLGDVAVNVVFLESNGRIDANTENWTPAQTEAVKANIDAGLQWWTDTLKQYSDVHTLNFEVDYTFADNPVETSYEPISRNSQDFTLWIEEFFRTVDVPSASGFSTEIRNFNHQQRLAHDTNWSFTIFVVNTEQDADNFFGSGSGSTDFKRAFAYSGGQFIVLPYSRPASTVAHEVGHMFWAFDEYSNGESYRSSRGYYGTQNSNGRAGRAAGEVFEQESSIMATLGTPFREHHLSQSAAETIGWKDSDGDGIFDFADVPHSLDLQTNFDQQTRTVALLGTSSVQTLNNRNTAGTGNDITLNRITDLQYRIDAGPWIDLAEYDAYEVSISTVTPEIPQGTSLVEFRTIDDRIGVSSATVAVEITDPELHNSVLAADVDGDGVVAPIDALRVITWLNNPGLNLANGTFLDTSGDGEVTALDALIVINYINQAIGNPSGSGQIDDIPITESASDPLEENDTNAVAGSEQTDAQDANAIVIALFSRPSGGESEPDFWSDDEDDDWFY